jgi:hypothetical protein
LNNSGRAGCLAGSSQQPEVACAKSHAPWACTIWRTWADARRGRTHGWPIAWTLWLHADAVRAGRRAVSAPNMAFRTIVTIAPGLPTLCCDIRDFVLHGLVLNPIIGIYGQWSGRLRCSAWEVSAGARGWSMSFRAGRSMAWFKNGSETVVRSTLRAVRASVRDRFCIRPFFGFRRAAGNVLLALAGTRRAPLRTAHGVCLLLITAVRLTPAFGKAWIRWRTRKFFRIPCQKVPNNRSGRLRRPPHGP